MPATQPLTLSLQVTAPGYKSIVTQIFDKAGEYLHNDTVFAVKDSLVVDFTPLQGNDKAEFELAYDFKLASCDGAAKHSIGSSSG